MESEAYDQVPDKDKVRDWAFQQLLRLHALYYKKAIVSSVFLVYAHNSEHAAEPPAYADVAKSYIGWLKEVLDRVISDRAPIVDSGQPLPSDRADSNSSNNILKNQMRLLPSSTPFGPGEERGGVARVVVCGSALLSKYAASDFAFEFIPHVKRLYKDCIGDQLADATTLENKLYKPLCTYIDECVKKRPEFHHVLTELAFLEIRCGVTGAKSIIFPVALDKNLEWPDLQFLHSVDIQARIDPALGVRDQHRNFFKLMKHLFKYSKFRNDLGELYNEFCESIERTVAGRLMTWGEAEVCFYRAKNEFEKTATSFNFEWQDSIFNVNRPPSPYFVPRQSILDAVQKQLVISMEQKIRTSIGLVGASGFGKTELATCLAQWFRGRGHVLWATGRSFNEFLNDCQCQAVMAGLCDDTTVNLVAAQKLMALLDSSESGHWLFVIDDMAMDDSDSAQLASLLPKSRGTILVTSQSRAVKILEQGRVYAVDQMQKAEAVQLCDALHRDTQYSPEALGKFVDKVACLPLAIVQSATYVKATGKSLLDYLQEPTLNLDNFLPHGDGEKGLGTMLVPTLEVMASKNPVACLLVQVIARLDTKSIPRKLLLLGVGSVFVLRDKSTFDESAFDGAMAYLIDKRLVTLLRDMRHIGETTYEMHDMMAQLVNAWARKDRVHILDMAASLLHAAHVQGRVFPVLLEPQYVDLANGRHFVPHADRLIAALREGDVWQKGSAEQHRRWLDVVRRCGADYLMSGRGIKEAQEYLAFYCDHLRNAHDAGNMDIMGDKKDWLYAMTYLAGAYNHEGNIVATEETYDKAMKLCESLHDDDDLLKREVTCLLHFCLSDLFFATQNYPRAMESIKAAQAVWGGDGPPLPFLSLKLHMQSLYGSIRLAMGDCEEAFAELDGALRGYQRYSASPEVKFDGLCDQRDYLVKADLASIYELRGDHVNAKRLYQAALEGAEAIKGPDSVATLDIKVLCANALFQVHEGQKAEKMLEDVLKRCKRAHAYGNQHKRILSGVYLILCRKACQTDEFPTALEWVDKAIELWQEGANHEQEIGYYAAVSDRTYILLRMSEIRNEEAKKAYQKVQEGFTKLGLPTTYALQQYLWLLRANLMLDMNDHKGCESFLREWKNSLASSDTQSIYFERFHELEETLKSQKSAYRSYGGYT